MSTSDFYIVAMVGLWILPMLVNPLALIIGYAVGKMPCWDTWQGYVALFIVTPLVVVAGIDSVEAVIDCLGLGCGFKLSRRATP